MKIRSLSTSKFADKNCKVHLKIKCTYFTSIKSINTIYIKVALMFFQRVNIGESGVQGILVYSGRALVFYLF